MDVGSQCHTLATLLPGKSPPGIHSIEALMGPRHSLDTLENHNSFVVHPMAQMCLAVSEMHYTCLLLCCLSVL